MMLYTHQLPYGVRRELCNLLDADQSWRTLGGQSMGLDVTQLKLVEQAYLRNGSPTDELLTRLDSSNAKIAELCYFLQQIGHWRALDLMRRYEPSGDSISSTTDGRGHQSFGLMAITADGMQAKQPFVASLDTPTPSFADLPASSVVASRLTSTSRLASTHAGESAVPIPTPSKCHKSHNHHHQQQQQQNLAGQQHMIFAKQSSLAADHTTQRLGGAGDKGDDPGEEMVRLACASNRKRTSINDQDVVNQLRLIMQIKYAELQLASDNFADANVLGNGGFACVYRGRWKGTDVAIKRLKCNLVDQALNELTILNSYRIDNILPIYGISIDGPQACLVYQFMSNGSLEDRLSCKRQTPPLSWLQRKLIGEGLAKGLFYLHTLREKPLVHGDVKAANVLLDSQFVPKLGDFGLARQVFKANNPREQADNCTHCTVSSIHGTSVYLPPEYLRHKILSPAVDVYSYGVVLLEMATGRRAYDGKRLLIDLVEDETRDLAQGQIGYTLKDARLANDTQDELKIWFELLIKLGLECANRIKKRRPDMGRVLARFVDFKCSDEPLHNSIRTISTNELDGGNPLAAPVNFVVSPPAVALGDADMTPMSCDDLSMQNNPLNARNSQALTAELHTQETEGMIPLLTELGIKS